MGRLPPEGGRVQLRCHTHVREDALQLFGFATAEEEELFHLLISVSGVGPRLGINILSGMPATELAAAIFHSEIARLTKISGVGKKTAERLIVELKDRMPALAPTGETPPPPGGPAPLKDDLVSALANLGYSRSEAEKGVDRALREDAGGRFEDLLRLSLRVLSGR
jgi:Holliday junction DNA helicase RuvA